MRKLTYRVLIFIFTVLLAMQFASCSLFKSDNDNDTDQGDNRPGNIQTTEPDYSDTPANNNDKTGTQSGSKKDTTTIRIRAVGDIMMHSRQIEAGKKDDGTYDFRYFYEIIKPYLEDADITVGNFECTIGDGSQEYSGYPVFRSPEAVLDSLAYAGFDVLTTANNHSFDGRDFGVEYTLDKMDEKGILHTGTARSAEERDTVLIVEKNDIKVAFLSYTYGTNGMEVTIPREKLPYMINYIDKELISKDIKRAREEGADAIVVAMHWGIEEHRTPNSEQKELADFLFSEGVDVILGSHPHVIQPMEKRRITLDDGTEKEVFLIYSLGNFISNQTWQYVDSGVILDIEIKKDHKSGKVTVGEIGYIPTWVQRTDITADKSEYKVLPVSKYLNNDDLSEKDSSRLKEVWNETTEQISGEAFKVIE